MKIWRVIVCLDNGDNDEHYLFIERTGKLSESRLRLFLYEKFSFGMFDRPELTLHFIRNSEVVRDHENNPLKCKYLKQIALGAELIRLN